MRKTSTPRSQVGHERFSRTEGQSAFDRRQCLVSPSGSSYYWPGHTRDLPPSQEMGCD